MLVKDKVYFRNRIPIPETKNDHYLFFMINGGVFENLPKPHTKLEHYLYNLCWNKVYGRKVYADAILNSNLELSNMGTTIFDLGENRVENGVKIKYRFMLKEGGNDTPATIFFKLFADNNSEQDDINFDSGYMARFSQLVETPVIGQLYEYEYTFPQNSNNFLLKDCRFLKPCIEIVKTEGGFGKTHAIEVQEISITLGDKIYYVTSTFKDYQGLESSIVKIIEPSDGELASEGSKWLSGEGVPNIIEGTVGDFYLHIPTGDVYTKQKDNTWVNTGLSIKGIRGEQGIQGIQGIQGVKGEKGDAFAVAKTFESIEAMNNGFANDGVKEGQFVIITSNVEDEDNAKLYVKGAKSYAFVSDLSGATGIKGDQGIQGIQGVPGKNGAKWWHGTGALTDNTIGADGDYYLDRTTGDVYTKTKGAWGKANVNIKGKDGSTIIEGSLEKPVDTEGNEGDFYLNTTNGDLWKKKNNIWEKIANFKGEKGDKGLDGNKIINGTLDTPDNKTGNDGDFYLNTNTGELWKKDKGVYTKLTTLKGDKGDTGLTGVKGDTGVGIKEIKVEQSQDDSGVNTITIVTTDGKQTKFTVKNGSKGDKGETGATGSAGASGVATQGNDGKDGKTWKPTVAENGDLTWEISNNTTPPTKVNIKGATGSAGKNGLDGSKWYGGDNYSEVTTPKNGDFFLKSDGTVWKYNIDKWEDTGITLKGQKGDRGEKGEQGDPGVTTTTTGQTVQGAKGDKGDTWKPTVTTDGKLTWAIDSSTNAPQEVNIKGADGKAGKNGTVWYSGTDAPKEDTGVLGDFYLQNGGKVWKREANGWVDTGISLQGAKGENGKDGVSTSSDGGQVTTVKGEKGDPGVAGKDGSEWFSGTTEPASANLTTAVDGDYYLQSDGKVWKKTGGQWTNTGISLKGATGEKGEQGEPGQTTTSTGTPVAGAKGDKGDPGQDGVTWKPSVDEQGNLTWTVNNDTTTPPTKVNIKGEQGIPGVAGEKGEQGVAGTPGSKWHNGNVDPNTTPPSNAVVGDYYIDNTNGKYYIKEANTWRLLGTLKGADGTNAVSTGGGQAVKGEKGDPGVPGTPGEDGATWHVGILDPTQGAFAQGKIGDLYLNSTTGNFYKKTGTNANQWVLQGSLKGVAGEKGEAGAKGEAGVAGIAGKDGATWKPNVSPEGVLTWTLDTDTSKAPAEANIKGATGDSGKDGKNGTVWFNGTGKPDDNVNTKGSVAGDYYLDGATGDIYKKEANGWSESSVANIKGKQGEKGEAGQNGTAGVAQQGQAGTDGKDGQTYKPEIKGNQITWTPTTETSPVNFVIPQEIEMSETQPVGQVKNNVWIDISTPKTTT